MDRPDQANPGPASFEQARQAGLHLVDCQRRAHEAKSEYRSVIRRLEAQGTPTDALAAGLEVSGDPEALQALTPMFYTNRWEQELLEGHRFAVATLIDVGAAIGTEVLYDAFPGAHTVLIEPVEEFGEVLRKRALAEGDEYLRLAVGAEDGQRTILVDRRVPQKTSFLKRAPDWTSGEAPEAREVRIATLDRLWDEHGWQGPFGLKIDTKGFDHEVIRGAGRLLAETAVVIAEVPVAERFQGGYSFADFVALMGSHGFEFCDILSMTRTVNLRELVYMDAVFRPRAPRAGASLGQG